MSLLRFLLASGLVLVVSACWAQESNNKSTAHIGGPCEGCEAIYEYGNRRLSTVDTLPGFETHNPKIKLTGTVYQSDGKTPAPHVIIYIYHTNRQGIYEDKADSQGWERRHGQYRGWVATDKNGKYTFFTFRPGAYPNGQEPEHIHMTVLEPGKNEYYIDDIYFDDDPKLTVLERATTGKRGGSGLVKLQKNGDLHTAVRDIILGLHIPDYPE